ncbi:MAG: hypothetical protein ACK5Z5_08755 [Neisseriaceae bacterium]
MEEYQLVYSNLQKNKNNLPYDVIFYKNKFYAGNDLFRNFYSYITEKLDIPVKTFITYSQAQKHFLNHI